MKITILLFLSLMLINPAVAQDKDTTTVENKKSKDYEARSKTSYKAIPLPSYDPSTKWGMSLMLMANYYTNNTDTITRPSLSAIMGFATTNGSWGVGLIQSLNLKQDRWRLSGRIMSLSINQELELGELGIADATRKMSIISADGKRRIVGNLFAGIGYSYSGVNYEGRDPESQLKLEQAGFLNKTNNHGISYGVLYDTRDKIYYPYQGMYFNYTLGQNFSSDESVPNDFLEHAIDLRHYFSVMDNHRHVIASHFYGRFLTGNPTNENYSFYGRSGMAIQRGYEVGTYIDKNLLSLEVEYRYESNLMKKKLGFMAFVSAGKVYGDFNTFNAADLLPAVGGGLRYRILPYERLNVKFDVAYGRDGVFFLFGMRETF